MTPAAPPPSCNICHRPAIVTARRTIHYKVTGRPGQAWVETSTGRVMTWGENDLCIRHLSRVAYLVRDGFHVTLLPVRPRPVPPPAPPPAPRAPIRRKSP